METDKSIKIFKKIKKIKKKNDFNKIFLEFED